MNFCYSALMLYPVHFLSSDDSTFRFVQKIGVLRLESAIIPFLTLNKFILEIDLFDLNTPCVINKYWHRNKNI